MTAPSARAAYISLAANRASNVADSRPTDGLVAFGAGRFIALWHSTAETHRGVHASLAGHPATVTTLKFVPPSSGCHSTFLASGDSAGGVRLWKENRDGLWSTYAVVPASHSRSISSLAALALPAPESTLLVTGGSDSSVHIYAIFPTGQIELVQKMDLKGKIPLDMALSWLPSTFTSVRPSTCLPGVILAIGATDARLQIYCSPILPSLSFTKSLSLEGHTDWIRALSFLSPPPSSTAAAEYDLADGEILLASGSQDTYIRLWRLSSLTHMPSNHADDTWSALRDVDDEEIRVKAFDFTVGANSFSVSSEAVLVGHDAWVTGLHWVPVTSASSPWPPAFQLLSASADRSMIIWMPAPGASSIWTSHRRFGEFTSPTNLGFFGALWGTGANVVLAHGWGGAWHVWERTEGGEGGEDDQWTARLAPGGHGGGVKAVEWEPEGEWLLSAGDDMSTRLHGTWRRPNELVTWHELARPQIHGYPISSLAFTNRLEFISGAEEKIVRVFDAPTNFLRGLETLSDITGLATNKERPMAANVPPLGLSNRAIASAAEAEQLAPESKDPFDTVAPVDFTVTSHPPFEEQLLGSTLWPETEKIYGHGYEIMALASAHCSPLVATACKSTSAEHAVVRLYETRDWKPFGKLLFGHALTVTRIVFSHDDRWLLSVSRDRSWRVFERVEDGYRPLASSTSHARIIWDAAWAFDDSFFVTASRDKTVKIWSPSGQDSWLCSATLKMTDAATALASTYVETPRRHLLAVGLESGAIHLYTSLVGDASAWTPYLVIDSDVGHVQTVASLAFCSRRHEGTIQLASGSDDRSVRILEIRTA